MDLSLNKRIKKIGLIVKPHAKELKKYLNRIIKAFQDNKITLLIPKSVENLVHYNNFHSEQTILSQAEIIVVIGGDGTFLSVASKAAESSKPILGINMGDLGFLTEFTKNEFLEFLPSLIKGNYKVEKRTLLKAKTKTKTHKALNDIVFSKENLARMIKLRVKVNNLFFAKIRSDGLIISTPTGSTAYNLSSGGPIVSPNCESLLITPICSHSLTLKPVAISSNSKIEVSANKKYNVVLTIDGQTGEKLKPGTVVRISEFEKKLELIKNPDRDYFSILREKLKWG